VILSVVDQAVAYCEFVRVGSGGWRGSGENARKGKNAFVGYQIAAKERGESWEDVVLTSRNSEEVRRIRSRPSGC
jgi:hypothetical protein